MTANKKYNMWTGVNSSGVNTSSYRENKKSGIKPDSSYVPTSKKMSSPRFKSGYPLHESTNKSSEKKRSKY